MNSEKHIIVILVEDHPGVLLRITGLFTRRGFNINTITAGKTMQKGVTKIIITLNGDKKVLEQVEKQVNKLIGTIKVFEIFGHKSLIKELCLIKFNFNVELKKQILKQAKMHNINILSENKKSIIIEIVDNPEKIDSFIKLIEHFDIKDISRTGVTYV